MILKMDKEGIVYTLGVDGQRKDKHCHIDGIRRCGLYCMSFWESRAPDGRIDSVILRCYEGPQPVIPVEVDK